jgi:two-component system chemotaxis sensor kinase CheA
MDHMAAIRVTFFQECEDQLAALEQGLMTMEEGNTSSETVNAVFRAVHSIKGGAGAFQLTQLVSFAHVFETALDRVRSNVLVPDMEVMKLFLRAADALADLVADSRDGIAIDDGRYAPILDEFAGLNGGGADEVEEEEIDFSPVAMTFDPPTDDNPATGKHTIHFHPHAALFAKANEPIALFRALAHLGQVEALCDAVALPGLDALDPEGSYLSWEIVLTGDVSLGAVQEVFEFVDGDCDLSIAAGAEVAPAPVPDVRFDELLASLQPDPSPTVESAKTPEVDQPAQGKAQARTVTQPTIRVDLDRVDRLINLVGELVINQAMLSQRVVKSGHARDARVAASLDELEQLTRELQESVMAIRAQPVKPLFQRMSRIVREVADATSKDVRLRTEGEGTEVDKTVVELLADPLTHMIRNAVDHGLETPDERLAKGKPAEGVVKLSAAHRSGRVVIEVADDGAGISRARVLEKAVSKGLVAPDAQLSESEIDNLLFLPGFSTASAVSNISGRGVGMDVVKRSIQALGGRISIASRPNQGSTFTMSLPLTLAVLDGIVVSVDDQTYVIPLTTIIETLQPEPQRLHAMGDGAFVMRIRENFVPLIDVGAELGVRPLLDTPRGGVAILVESESGSRNALLVDAIQDQRQVVIKSLETNYTRIHGVAAATILGDGRVAMILDVDGLVRRHTGERAGPDNSLAMAS